MKQIFSTRKVLSIYIDEAEYRWIELQAGGNISEWCRRKLMAERERGEDLVGESQTIRASDVPGTGEVPRRKRGTRSAGGVKGACEHGVSPGHWCLRCNQAIEKGYSLPMPNGSVCEHGVGKGEVCGTCGDKLKATMKRNGRCAHGTAKGDRCWQCGGLAMVE